ncbi:MAG: RDD family protein [Alphaproteobacteria bacterium]|nr:RDD family protein [Alphaproteobacteria bacterium]
MSSAQLPTSSSTPRARQENGVSQAYSDPRFLVGIPFKRVIAYLVDVIAIAVLAASIAVITFVPVVLSLGLLKPFVAGLIALVPVLYHTLLIGGERPATLGMRLLGIEVRRLNGDKPGYGLALIQTMLFYVTVSLTSWLILLVALFNRKHRTLHDFLCGTMVINVSFHDDPAAASRP